MRRIVVDTNVLLDIVVFDDARTHALRAAIVAGALGCVRSVATDDEFANVLQRPQFALDQARIDAALAWWQSTATLVERVVAAPWSCTDPLDQKFLDLACGARAQALVTKDKALLKLARRARRDGLQIVLPQTLAAVATA